MSLMAKNTVFFIGIFLICKLTSAEPWYRGQVTPNFDHAYFLFVLTIPPLNILFVEIAAKWLHPELFQDINPAQTLVQINWRFLAKPLPAPCWADQDIYETVADIGVDYVQGYHLGKPVYLEQLIETEAGGF